MARALAQWLSHGPLTTPLIWIGAGLVALAVTAAIVLAVALIARGIVALLR